MHKSFNMIKLYKCSIDNCHNYVRFKNSFCSDCITKIYNNQFRVEFCVMCGDSYKIFTTDKPEYDEEELFVNALCDKCSKDFIDKLRLASGNLNDDDKDENDYDEDDDIPDIL